MVRLASEPAAAVAVKSRSHLQASDSDPQVVLTSRKLHPIVCNSEPSLPINGILLRVSPTFLGFAAEHICFDVVQRPRSVLHLCAANKNTGPQRLFREPR
jgi:hypothetical protein